MLSPDGRQATVGAFLYPIELISTELGGAELPRATVGPDEPPTGIGIGPPPLELPPVETGITIGVCEASVFSFDFS